MKKPLLLIPLLAALLGGCQALSGTRVETVTSEKPAPATLQKLLVVGVTITPQVQAGMEQAFARRLEKHGGQVVLASQWFPGEKEPMREEVVRRIRAEGVTGVLAVRLLSYEIGEAAPEAPEFSLKAPARVPGTRVGWDQDPWLEAAPPAPVPSRRAEVETRLYDVATGKVVWQAHSRTQIKSDAQSELDGFVSAIMLELHRSGWLPPL